MQDALPYRAWISPSTTITSSSATAIPTGPQPKPPDSGDNSIKTGTSVKKVIAENAIIVFGRRGCCMCHVVKRLLQGLGVNPPVVEVDEREESAVIDELMGIGGGSEPGMQFPAVFVAGKLFGGLEKVMATHISGELVPILKDAGALWL